MTIKTEPLHCPNGCGWVSPPARGQWSRVHNRVLLDEHESHRRDGLCPVRQAWWQMHLAPQS